MPPAPGKLLGKVRMARHPASSGRVDRQVDGPVDLGGLAYRPSRSQLEAGFDQRQQVGCRAQADPVQLAEPRCQRGDLVLREAAHPEVIIAPMGCVWACVLIDGVVFSLPASGPADQRSSERAAASGSSTAAV